MKAPIKGSYYKEQLRRAPDPNSVHLLIEKVLRTKKYQGKTFKLVKYLFYPDKFNAWVPANEIKTGMK